MTLKYAKGVILMQSAPHMVRSYGNAAGTQGCSRSIIKVSTNVTMYISTSITSLTPSGYFCATSSDQSHVVNVRVRNLALTQEYAHHTTLQSVL